MVPGYESEMWETLKDRVKNFYADSKKEEYLKVLNEISKIENKYIIKASEDITNFYKRG